MNILFPIVILIILIGLLVLLLFFFRMTLLNLLNALKGAKREDLPPVRASASASTLRTQAADGPMAATVDVAKLVAAQSLQAIVFRQQFPPSFAKSLSYFGGAPTAPASFQWPHWQDQEGKSRALTFLMQINCGEIPAAARLGVMPDDGVLYFFMEIAESLLGSAYRVIHHAGPTDGWREAPLPANLPPAISRYRCKYAMEERHLPRLLPRWTFTPTVIDIPAAQYGEREEDAPYLWSGVSAEALTAAQGGPISHNPYSIKDFPLATDLLRKPFATFPHDWRAVQYLMRLFIDKLDDWQRYPNTAPLDKTLSDEEKRRQLAHIQEKAQQLYDSAAGFPADQAVPASDRDGVWAFLASEARLSRFILAEAVTLSVEETLARSPEAAALIPLEVAERLRGRHALVTTYEGKEHVNTPERMLAPPSDVQGGQWEWAGTHLLLLELSSAIGLGRDFGEGVCQLYIAPADLQARRFDKVKLAFEAY
jgi:hypothetical protein